MNRLRFAVLAIAAAALAAACPNPRETVRPLSDMTMLGGTVASSAAEAALGGSFGVDFVHPEDECWDLPEGTYAELAGYRLEKRGGYAVKGGCSYPSFAGGPIPFSVGPSATLRIVDGGYEVSMTVGDLLVARTVALRAPATALVEGERVYLDLLPDQDETSEISLFYFLDGGPIGDDGYPDPVFELHSYNYDVATQVRHDVGGWSFVVPPVATGTGRLLLYTYGHMAQPACVNVAECSLIGSFTREVTTSSVAAAAP